MTAQRRNDPACRCRKAMLSGVVLGAFMAGCQTPSAPPVTHTAIVPPQSPAASYDIQLASAQEPSEKKVVPPSPEEYDTPPQELTITADTRADRQVYPLDLSTALRLGDANSLEIELARNRYEGALLREEAASALWLPDLIAGPSYQYHDGQIQRAIGEVFDTRRQSFFIGGGPVLSWDLSEVLYAKLVAHQVVHARSASVGAARNQTLLEIAEGYFDLLAAHAALAVAQETRTNAERLAEVTDSFAKRGVGLPSDAARAQTEFQFRKQQERLARERTITASAALARRLHLDARVQLVPVETKLVPLEIYPTDGEPGAFVDLALQHRPEIEEGRWLVSAADARVQQACWAPLLPRLQVGYAAGGFGGGYIGDPKGFFNSFNNREDLSATAVWQLRNLGFGDSVRQQGEQLELTNANLQLARVVDRVTEEVVSAHESVASRHEQLDISRQSVTSAIESLDKNVQRIREGAGLPIEVLQSLQALDRARLEYLQTLTSFNKSQFRLFTATGNIPLDADLSQMNRDAP